MEKEASVMDEKKKKDYPASKVASIISIVKDIVIVIIEVAKILGW